VSDIFRVSTKAVIHKGGKFLIVQKPSGAWDLPGGRLELDEDPENGLAREVEEELGVSVEIGELVDCCVRPKIEKPDVFCVAYLCDMTFDLEDIRLSDEHVEARLLKLDGLKGLEVDPGYRRIINRAARRLAGEAAPLTLRAAASDRIPVHSL